MSLLVKDLRIMTKKPKTPDSRLQPKDSSLKTPDQRLQTPDYIPTTPAHRLPTTSQNTLQVLLV